MTVGINIDLDEVVAWLEIAQQMPEMTQREATIAMSAAVGSVEREVVPRTPVNTGQLRGAWTKGRVIRGQGVVKGEVMNLKEYAIVVEKGRKASANMAPIEPLAYWFRRKYGLSQDESVKAAWGLAINLKSRNIKPVKMLEEGFKAAEPAVRRIFDKVPEKVFNRLK
jgi:hypothetical protein